jgi:hypothetical protein
MPFFSDIETRDEPRGPIWGPFATIRDNVERLVALNLGWSLQLAPGGLALALPGLPAWLRIALGLFSATAVLPATAVLYALAFDATRGEHLSVERAVHHLRALALPSVRALAPLYGLFGGLIWAVILIGPVVPAVATLATLAALVWSVAATSWGPLLVCRPDASARSLAGWSLWLVWRYPAESLATSLAVAIALVIGLVSIGGLVLIVPVVNSLLHTERYLDLAGRPAVMAIQE